ncbi:Localization factor PodJL [compost metagenome]
MEKDKQQAALWFRKAAEQGDADAQHALGRIYDSGQGVAQDISESYAWYSVAATNGSKGAIERRESTGQKLSQAQLDAAQELAGVYLEKYPKRK